MTLAACRAGAEDAAACAAAEGLGLKYALSFALVFMAWAALHFLWAGRTLARDRVS